MTGFWRVPRRPDGWSSPHERARARAAERLDTMLDPDEAAWLDAHLDECAACRAVAAAYLTDRAALRSLRDVPIEPPRDLWARTAAGIEREAAHRGSRARPAERSRSRRARFPVGAMSGIAVVVIVVGAAALSGGWLDQPVVGPASTAPGAAATPDVAAVSLAPAATPFSVAAGSVGWLRSLGDGAYAYNRNAVDQVCPVDDQPGCAALDETAAKRIDLTSTPRTVIGSPTDDQAVVVGSDGSGADQILVMSLPASRETAPTATPTPSPTTTATPEPTPAETATASPTGSDTASTEPSESPVDSAEPTAEPTATPTTTATPKPTPSDTPAPPSPTPSPSVAASPQATATAIAIATGVTVVGQSAAFSADGKWFAFTARPADASAGPDIYVWHMGDDGARRLTTDGASVFASWSGDQVVGSRLDADPSVDGGRLARSFIIDPKNGKPVGEPIDLWRPVVDPTDRFAVAWSGTVDTSDAATLQVPGKGELILTSWQPDATSAATRTKIAGVESDLADFDVRWDESGQWLAIWTADVADPSIGRLSLFRLDRGSGTLQRPKSAPTDVPALPGFSIGDGRLAWVTPHGQDAEGSKVQVVAWSGNSVGAVESVPGEDVVVVR